MGKIDGAACEHGHEDHPTAKKRMQALKIQAIDGLRETHFAHKLLQSV